LFNNGRAALRKIRRIARPPRFGLVNPKRPLKH